MKYIPLTINRVGPRKNFTTLPKIPSEPHSTFTNDVFKTHNGAAAAGLQITGHRILVANEVAG